MNLTSINKATKGKVKTTGVSPFLEIEIEKVYPNPEQPREVFEDIGELSSSIVKHGLLEPIAVVKRNNKYMIVAGERRYKAHLHHAAKTIKAHIVDMDEHQIQIAALIENIQRNDLTDFETAKYIGKLWASGEYPKKQDLAEDIGKSSSYLSKCFSCLKLDDSIINDLEQNKNDVPLSVLEEIARVKDVDTQNEVYEKYLNGEIIRDDIKDYKSFKDKTFNDGCEFSPGKKEDKQKDERYEDGVFEAFIGKYTLTGTVGFDGRSLSCENLGAFHLYGSVSDTLFNKEKKYKIIIEEI
ncbi:ParB/RepB/Spo0J family partition protein [Poseidonibacter lekithochrous]|uniref:ParB/RepB/Spo0J family partition protein n=1 Tax=Poseidonibacter lekithochrous TaxID=1904463 RepID=UPI0013DAF390|nr:ParB/RepB/Spo0J family partition protein [Poseidonibacter lekithochrous]